MNDVKKKTQVISPTEEQGMTIENVRMSPFLRKIALFSSGGSFLDGYVLSLIGVALTQITPMFNLTTMESALIGASVMVGILFGTLIGGYFTDRIGRRVMFIIDLAAIGALSVISMFLTTPAQLIICRVFIGVFVGADYPIATSLIAEFTPMKHRAVSMGVVSAAWYLGATVAAFVGFFLYDVEGGWKLMLGSAVIPCIILLIGRRDIPESPRWLAKKGRMDEARSVMERVYGPGVELVYEEVETKVSLVKLFKGGYGKRMFYVSIMILCQVVPMYMIYTFGPDIMHAFGLDHGKDSIFGESVVSLFFLIGTIPAMFWLNSMGRRKLLIGSFALMAVGLLILGIWPAAPVLVIIVAFGLYAFFSGGPGILQWLYPNELFPTDVRASAVGVAISFTRIGTIIGTYATPYLLANFGVGPTMLVAAVLVIFALVLSIFMAPETKGKTLVEASSVD